MFKPDLEITFWVVILMISWKDLVLMFYTWAPNTTIEGTTNTIQFKQHFTITF